MTVAAGGRFRADRGQMLRWMIRNSESVGMGWTADSSHASASGVYKQTPHSVLYQKHLYIFII